jgi:STE24 endopeptidase
MRPTARLLLPALLLSALAAAPGAHAQSAGQPAIALAIAPATTAAAPAPAADQGPVAVPAPSEKAMRYYRSGVALWLFDTLWGLLVPAVILFTGFSARLRNAASGGGRRGLFVTAALYFVLYTAVTTIVDLPLAYYEGFVREHAYGLSQQTAAKFWSDAGKSILLGTVLGALTIWLPYLLLRKSPRRWWLYTGLLAIPFVVLLELVTPIWIEPLFNQFGPMKDKALEAQILALAARAGISGGRVYEVAKSVDTETVNAYVNGLGSTKRIVVWDTTLKKLTPRETLAVVGHEMGHYVLGHVLQGIALLSALLLVGLYAVHRTANGLIARYGDRFGFRELGDVASLPLMSLVFGVTLLVLSPAVLAVSRHEEHEADRFGLEVTHDNHALGTAFVKLQQENLDNPRPGPLVKLFRASHPPLGERIDFTNAYHPWTSGEPGRYDRLIRPAGGSSGGH